MAQCPSFCFCLPYVGILERSCIPSRSVRAMALQRAARIFKDRPRAGCDVVVLWTSKMGRRNEAWEEQQPMHSCGVELGHDGLAAIKLCTGGWKWQTRSSQREILHPDQCY